MNEEKRKHILYTAMKLFNEHGFHACPTSKIAKKARISVGTLFNYFNTKEELIQAIYIEVKIHSRERFLTEITQEASKHDTLLSMWRAVIIWGIENPDEFNYLELYSHSPFKHLYKDKNIMESFATFKDTILSTIKPTTQCLEYPEYHLAYIDNSLHAATRFIIDHEINDIETFIRSSFNLIWEGYSNH